MVHVKKLCVLCVSAVNLKPCASRITSQAERIMACGEIGPDVPLENIRAMYAAFREYGNYG